MKHRKKLSHDNRIFLFSAFIYTIIFTFSFVLCFNIIDELKSIFINLCLMQPLLLHDCVVCTPLIIFQRFLLYSPSLQSKINLSQFRVPFFHGVVIPKFWEAYLYIVKAWGKCNCWHPMKCPHFSYLQLFLFSEVTATLSLISECETPSAASHSYSLSLFSWHRKLSRTTYRLYHLQDILWPHWNYLLFLHNVKSLVNFARLF